VAAPNRRLRWPDDLDPKLRKWLTRVQRVQAHLRSTIAIYAVKRNVGGCSLFNQAYNQRAANNDRTILYDALTLAMDEFAEVREEVQRIMDGATPTKAMPGSRDKVETMKSRAADGRSIFVDGDARH
jgi:hypothetical protein